MVRAFWLFRVGGQGRGRTADLPLFRRSVLARPPGAVNGINAALPAERGFSMCGITLALVPTCAGKCRLIRGFLVGDLTAGPDLWDFCGEATHARIGNSGRRRGGYAEANTVPRGPRPPRPARLRRSASSRPPLSRPTPKVTTCPSPSSRKHADRRLRSLSWRGSQPGSRRSDCPFSAVLDSSREDHG